MLRELDLDAATRGEVDTLLRLLDAIEAKVELLDRQLQQIAHCEDQVKLLMTLPGVSYTTAIALLATLGDIGRFRDGHHAASYLGLVPSTRQSAGHCYHGRITKAGNAQARWMLTQGVQHIANHPGPLGIFFRRLCRRKNRNIAITALARKLVTIAYLMLKNNEPYRYAVPKRTHEKLRKVRTRGTGQPSRTKPGQVPRDLPRVYREHGLPSAQPLDQLPAGERRMLEASGALQAVQVMHGADAE